MICLDVSLYDTNCMLVSEQFTAELFRGLADGFTTPDFMYLQTFVLDANGLCASDPDSPPLGLAYFYQVNILGSDGGVLPTCGT